MVLCWTTKFFSIHKDILGFFNVALVGPLNYSQFIKKMKNFDPSTVFGTNITCSPTPRFTRILVSMQKYFPNY